MLDRRRLLGLPATAPLVFAAAVIATLVIYWPALGSDFSGDDYLLLLASREMSWGEFLRATWDPGADPGVLQLSYRYWRPLSFLTFRVTNVFAGDNALPYHLVNLGSQLAAIGLVYGLSWRLTKTELGAAVAAIAFAVHPAGIESVAWIAAVNSAALPLALGSWLAFAVAVDGPVFRRRPFVASMLLLAAALAFRETSAAIAGAMLVWYVAVPARDRLAMRATWVISGTVVVILVLHALLLARVLSQDAGRTLWEIGGDGVDNAWYYVRHAVLPTTRPGAVVVWAQRVLGLAFLAVVAFAALRRQWTIAALGAGFLVALIPYAFFSLGIGPRYLYMPASIFALCLGAIAARVPDLLTIPSRAWERIAVAGLGVVALGATVVANDRVRDWVEIYPEPNEAWVEGLKAQHPELPEGGGVWVVDPPFVLVFFDGFIIPPIIHYLYDEQPQVYVISSEHLDFARSVQEPDDIFYIWEGSPAAGTLP